jgi:flagellar biosynthetic protein FlhB
VSDTPQEDKTEEATPKRKEQFRERGEIAKSTELAAGITLMGGAGALWATMQFAAGDIAVSLASIWYHLDEAEGLFSAPGLLFGALAQSLLVAVLPVMSILVVAALLAHVVQTGFLWAPKALEPKLSKLNTLSGLKRLFFSKDAVANLLKTLFKVTVVGSVAAGTLWVLDFDAGRLVRLSPEDFAAAMEEFSVLPLFATAIAVLAVGIGDYAWQRHRMNERMKMTKDEARREHKESEGDPLIRSRRKQKHREVLSANNLIESVPEATVVINNPTHYSVALRYKADAGPPVVVAKGVDYRAARIREIATDSDVPMVDNPPLARALHGSVDVGEAIPEAFFQAVAETLAFVWNQHGRS